MSLKFEAISFLMRIIVNFVLFKKMERFTLCPPLNPGSHETETDSAEISTRFNDSGLSGAPRDNQGFNLKFNLYSFSTRNYA